MCGHSPITIPWRKLCHSSKLMGLTVIMNHIYVYRLLYNIKSTERNYSLVQYTNKRIKSIYYFQATKESASHKYSKTFATTKSIPFCCFFPRLWKRYLPYFIPDWNPSYLFLRFWETPIFMPVNNLQWSWMWGQEATEKEYWW